MVNPDNAELYKVTSLSVNIEDDEPKEKSVVSFSRNSYTSKDGNATVTISLSEVAEIHGISRQGVHDLVRRCDKLLEGYENKLHLVERFVTLKSSVSELRELTKAYEKSRDDELFGQIDRLCQTILEEL